MNYKGKKAAFYTLGCKLNFSETSAIAGEFLKKGFERVEFEEKADVYVINSCSVTNQGDKASRNIIRQAVKKNPQALIVVTGCYAQLHPEQVAQIEGVDMILGSQEKYGIVSQIGNLEKRPAPEVKTTPFTEMTSYHQAFSRGDRTRSFLKIQDGCDYFCSYCTIPLARGRSRNDSVENTVAEARKAVSSGFKEIVLTGVNIGDFGKSTGEDFTGLLKELEKIKGLRRLRLGSVEPDLLGDEIIKLVANSTVLMPHFHIPLQSGSDEVLKLMKRRYSTELFAGRIQRIRELLPHAFIGVDVIAGTNGETEALFRESYDFIKDSEVSRLHAFTYSERTGTRALSIPGTVDPAERRRRTQMYLNLSEKKMRAFCEKQLGTQHQVLFESLPKEETMSGFTENYIRVEIPHDPKLANEIREVTLMKILPNGNMTATLSPR